MIQPPSVGIEIDWQRPVYVMATWAPAATNTASKFWLCRSASQSLSSWALTGQRSPVDESLQVAGDPVLNGAGIADHGSGFRSGCRLTRRGDRLSRDTLGEIGRRVGLCAPPDTPRHAAGIGDPAQGLRRTPSVLQGFDRRWRAF